MKCMLALSLPVSVSLALALFVSVTFYLIFFHGLSNVVYPSTEYEIMFYSHLRLSQFIMKQFACRLDKCSFAVRVY